MTMTDMWEDKNITIFAEQKRVRLHTLFLYIIFFYLEYLLYMNLAVIQIMKKIKSATRLATILSTI